MKQLLKNLVQKKEQKKPINEQKKRFIFTYEDTEAKEHKVIVIGENLITALRKFVKRFYNGDHEKAYYFLKGIKVHGHKIL